MACPPCSHSGCKNAGETVALFVESNGRSSEVSVCNLHYKDLHLGCLQPNPATVEESSLGNAYEECKLSTVLFGDESRACGFVLKSLSTGSLLVSKIDYVQACSIYGSIVNADAKEANIAPLTYELLDHIIATLGGSLVSIVLDGFDRRTACFTACLVVETQNGQARIKCRGADAVGIAYQAGVPIKVDVAFLGKKTNSGIFVFE